MLAIAKARVDSRKHDRRYGNRQSIYLDQTELDRQDDYPETMARNDPRWIILWERALKGAEAEKYILALYIERCVVIPLCRTYSVRHLSREDLAGLIRLTAIQSVHVWQPALKVPLLSHVYFQSWRAVIQEIRWQYLPNRAAINNPISIDQPWNGEVDDRSRIELIPASGALVDSQVVHTVLSEQLHELLRQFVQSLAPIERQVLVSFIEFPHMKLGERAAVLRLSPKSVDNARTRIINRRANTELAAKLQQLLWDMVQE